MDLRKIVVTMSFFVPEDRARKLEMDLDEWAREHDHALVRRSAEQEITIERTMSVTHGMENGTVSAVAYATTSLNRALLEIADFRWFGPMKIDARLLESRDEKAEEMPPSDDEDDFGEAYDGSWTGGA